MSVIIIIISSSSSTIFTLPAQARLWAAVCCLFHETSHARGVLTLLSHYDCPTGRDKQLKVQTKAS